MRFFEQPSSSSTLVVDIDSGSVGVGLVGARQSGALEPLYFARHEFPLHESERLERMLYVLRHALSRAFDAGVRAGVHGVDDVAITLSAPWSISRFRDTILEKEQPFSFDDALVEGLLAEALSELEAELSGDTEMGDTEIYESEVSSLWLNGYEVSSPTPFRKARSARASIHMSFSPKVLLREVGKEVDKVFSVRGSKKARSVFSAAKGALSHLFHPEKKMLLAHFSGDTVELFLVKGSKVLMRAVADTGPLHVYDGLAACLRAHPSIARSRMTLYERKLLDHRSSREVEEYLDSLAHGWREDFENLEGFSAEHSLLIADREHSEVGRRFISSIVPGATVVAPFEDADLSLGMLGAMRSPHVLR